MTKQRILIISQPYPPDPAATGKYMEDVALALANEDHTVEVLASRERLDAPSVRFKSSTRGGNIRVMRLPLSAFGKRSIVTRLLGAASFAIQCLIRGAILKRVDAIFVSTAPPTAPVVACLLAKLHRARLVYWIHDLNPDQVVALKAMSPRNALVQVGHALNRWVLSKPDRIVALDSEMAERAVMRGASPSSTITLPPWPHDDLLHPIPPDQNTFLLEKGWGDSFIVMYSGNIGLSHPLDTLLEAARAMRHVRGLHFAVIGQGTNLPQVTAFVADNDLSNVSILPYQASENLAQSLSAGDLHVVVTKDCLVGIVHPCKAYSSLAVERPILSIGPLQCPISTLVTTHGLGWAVATGDSQGVQEAIKCAMQEPGAFRDRRRRTIRRIRSSTLNKKHLCKTLCDEIVHSSRQLPTKTQQREQLVR